MKEVRIIQEEIIPANKVEKNNIIGAEFDKEKMLLVADKHMGETFTWVIISKTSTTNRNGYTGTTTGQGLPFKEAIDFALIRKRGRVFMFESRQEVGKWLANK